MVTLDKRVSEYENALNNTLRGYETSLNNEINIDKLEKYKYHIEKIKAIKEFGIKDYYALTALTNINIFSERSKDLSTEMYKNYMNSFGIEEKDELYQRIKNESNTDNIRNMIWKECYGMDYDLIPKQDAIKEETELINNSTLTPEERTAELCQLICKSGYNGNELCNPTYIKNFDLLKETMAKLHTENQKTL